MKCSSLNKFSLIYIIFYWNLNLFLNFPPNVWHHILLHHQFLGLNLQIVGVSFGHYPFEMPWSICNLMSSTHFEFKSLIKKNLTLYINCYEPIELQCLKIAHNSRYIECPILLIIYTLSSNAIKCHQVHLDHSFFDNNYPYSLVHLILTLIVFMMKFH
jgi:hypothetical protein